MFIQQTLTSVFVLSLLLQGYSTLPGYGNGKEAVRPITIWKGNSYTTISARDPAFSGKDSGKGDSDFNDSDSDVSGDTGLKKDGAVVPPMGGQNGKNNGKFEWLYNMMLNRFYAPYVMLQI